MRTERGRRHPDRSVPLHAQRRRRDGPLEAGKEKGDEGGRSREIREVAEGREEVREDAGTPARQAGEEGREEIRRPTTPGGESKTEGKGQGNREGEGGERKSPDENGSP